MKKIFIKDIINIPANQEVEILGWIKNQRFHGGIIFWTLVDSTGEIQIVLNKKNLGDKMKKAKDIPLESCVRIVGEVHFFLNQKTNHENIEIIAKEFELISEYKLNLSPHPRASFPIFDSKYTDYVLRHRSVYLRNPKQMAVLSFKSKFIFELHNYLQNNGFVFIEAPVFTEMLLYEDSSAFSFEVRKRKVFLSQCATFQLEAAIIAFEKVYSITTSFRAEPSRSNRHLNEFTHLKIELAWADLEDLSSLTEEMLYALAEKMKDVGKKELKILGIDLNLNEFKPPFIQISYDELVKLLEKEGVKFQYGRNLNEKSVSVLNKIFGNKMVWVRFLPRTAEPFPFKIHPEKPNLVMSAELIAPYGFGEIGGIAEKICSKKELLERMEEKGKNTEENLNRYKSYIQLRDDALPPHGGIGMGVDRLVRFFLKLPHVKDAIAYPRLFGRRWNP